MDRYSLSREFKMTLAQEKVRKIDDVFALQQLCCELLSSNFHLRESLRQSVEAEIPKKNDVVTGVPVISAGTRAISRLNA